MSFPHELVRRRVPQIVGAYAFFGWGLIQFVNFVETRYALSPRLVDLTALALVLLVPTVAALAWSHGAPGPDRWTRKQVTLMGTNILVGSVLLGFLFWGRDLGAVTQTVEVRDEFGEVVQRAVPKAEYRRSVLLYLPELEPRTEATEDLPATLITLLNLDLAQDLFLDQTTQFELRERLDREGLTDRPVPRSLMRTIAREDHDAFFVHGELRPTGAGYALTLHLEDTERGSSVAVREHEAPDLAGLVDLASRRLRLDLGIPEGIVREATDLPVAEITSESEEAIRALGRGVLAFALRNDYPTAQAHLEEAIRLDPGFAAAQNILYLVATLNQDRTRAQEALRAAMKNLYRLPERLQFPVKANYYLEIETEPDRALAVVQMWTQLLPQDLGAWQQLSFLHTLRGERQEAIRAQERVLEIDPHNVDALRGLARLHQDLGNRDEAERYLRLYTERFPDDPQGFRRLGQLHEAFGEFDAALQDLERALLLDPQNLAVRLNLVQILRKQGAFDEARAELDKLDATADDAGSRVSLLDARQALDRRLGRMRDALAASDRRLEAIRATTTPLEAAARRAFTVPLLIQGGRVQEARDLVAELHRTLAPPTDWIAQMAEALLHLELDEPEPAGPCLNRVEAFIRSYGIQLLDSLVRQARGRWHEARGELDEAVGEYEAVLQAEPQDETTLRRLGRALRKKGDPGRGRQYLERSLALDPSAPHTHLEMARTQLALGNRDEASKHLGEALRIWKDADPEFEPLHEAESFLKEIKTPS